MLQGRKRPDRGLSPKVTAEPRSQKPMKQTQTRRCRRPHPVQPSVAPGTETYEADKAEQKTQEAAESAVVTGAGEAMEEAESCDGCDAGGLLRKDEAGTTEATPEPHAGAETHAAETDESGTTETTPEHEDTPANEATDKEADNVGFLEDETRIHTGVDNAADDAAVLTVDATESSGGEGASDEKKAHFGPLRSTT